MSLDQIGDRFKQYEQTNDIRLTRRIPCIIRVDGRAFHSLCRHMDRPYDFKFQQCMQEVAIALCKGCQGAKIAMTHSDECSVLLTDYDTLNTECFLGYRVQKMTSLVASMATIAFGKKYRELFPDSKADPMLDCRVFSLPKEEVNSYFYWRQLDSQRNSISMLAQANFSHKRLHGLNQNQMQELLFQEKGVNWNDQPVPFKRGVCCVKESYVHNVTAPTLEEAIRIKHHRSVSTVRTRWVIDTNIPIFSQDRNYIEKYVYLDRAV